MNFKDKFKNYEDCMEPGVILPSIEVGQKKLDLMGISSYKDNYDLLRKLCHKGVERLSIHKKENKEVYYERAKTELSILEELGFTDYILLNWDILFFCEQNNIPTGPGRGSAAGSLVLYLIGVTKIDPVENDLFFERFVSKSRAKKIEHKGKIYLDGSLLADIDNDIAYEHRQKVIQYIEKSHPNRTAKILTLNTLSSKLCIKECGKIVGELEESAVNLVSSLIPKQFGKVMPISDSIKESEEFKAWADLNPNILYVAKRIEGLIKNTGVHPSGIAISHKCISDICPVQKTSEGALVTGYDMNYVAELMVKFDILGLRTLSVIDSTCKSVGINADSIDINSEEIYLPLQNLTSPHGLFQIEADTDFKVCKKVKPKNIEELSAVLAIARPGALEFMDLYQKYVETGRFQSVHEFFDEVLSYTGGIPLYQEQLMKMAVKVGFSLDESEQIRRIVGKKKVDKMLEWKSKIQDKIKSQNLDPEIGDMLWKVAEDSANYSFNKSHSIAYATLSAWTTYLKFKYPQDFFLSLLKMTRFEPCPQDEIKKISKELSFFNIKLLPPNLSKSSMDFSKEGENIRYGLNSIKGISEKSIESLIKFRGESPPSKYEMFMAAKQSGLNIGTLCALIQAGALSNFEGSRPLLVLEAQVFNIFTDREKRNFIKIGPKYNWKLLDAIVDVRDKKLKGDDNKPFFKDSRFETFRKKYQPYKDIYSQNIKSKGFADWYFETQLLGYSYSKNLKKLFCNNASGYKNFREYTLLNQNDFFKTIGLVEECLIQTSRAGNKYMRISISDEHGTFNCMLCNRRNEKVLDQFLNDNELPKENNIVVAYGQKGEDIMFLKNIKILNQSVYMKLADLK